MKQEYTVFYDVTYEVQQHFSITITADSAEQARGGCTNILFREMDMVSLSLI